MGLGGGGQWWSIAREAWDRTLIMAKFLCVLHVIDTYFCSSVLVYGPSMFPTLNPKGDVVLVQRLSTRFGSVAHGDVVLVRAPDNPNKIVTKRITGMEGDRVTFLVDPWRSERCATVQVPKGHLWIQGDNIYASKDSRHFGPVPYGLLQGKVLCRIWPPKGFGSLQQGVKLVIDELLIKAYEDAKDHPDVEGLDLIMAIDDY